MKRDNTGKFDSIVPARAPPGLQEVSELRDEYDTNKVIAYLKGNLMPPLLGKVGIE